MAQIDIQQVSWQEAETELRSIRSRVFIEEQQVPEELEWDEHDTRCVHFLARDDNGQPVGTVRLLDDGHIGRMAVLREWRGKGVGSALLEAVLELAQRRGFPEVMLNAQTSAVAFYQHFGFAADEEVFMDAGIPHQRMQLKL